MAGARCVCLMLQKKKQPRIRKSLERFIHQEGLAGEDGGASRHSTNPSQEPGLQGIFFCQEKREGQGQGGCGGL